MKKTTIYLPETLHEGLRELAYKGDVSVASLIRAALQIAYDGILDDIQDMGLEVEVYCADSTSSVTLEDFRQGKRKPCQQS